MSDSFSKLVELITRMPGIGPRHATRIALAMLEWSDQKRDELLHTLSEVFGTIHFCKQCFFVAENELCRICSDQGRDSSRIAVVEQVSDLIAFERVGIYKGLYHVLGGAINPAQGKLPSHLHLRELVSRIQDYENAEKPLEVILATGAHTHGETTALYLIEELKPLNIKITRLARGLASGSTIEYADPLTLTHALKERKEEI